jgi:hypothetical protein
MLLIGTVRTGAVCGYDTVFGYPKSTVPRWLSSFQCPVQAVHVYSIFILLANVELLTFKIKSVAFQMIR